MKKYSWEIFMGVFFSCMIFVVLWAGHHNWLKIPADHLELIRLCQPAYLKCLGDKK